MTLLDLADAIEEPSTKVILAKTLVHRLRLERGLNVDLETAWHCVTQEMRVEFVSKIEHMAGQLRTGVEGAARRKRAVRS